MTEPKAAAGPWIPMAERHPPLNVPVLIKGRSGEPEVRRLLQLTMSPQYAGPPRFGFYPGGSFEGWTHWAEVFL